MKNTITYALIAAGLFAATMFLSSCSKSGADPAQGVPERPIDVRITVIKPELLVDAFQVAGTVKAFEDVNVAPEEGGVVKEWKVKKGQYVEKGALLVTLRDEVIKAGFDAAQSQYQMAELNLTKQEKVFDQQGISELQYKNLQYGRDAAKANADLMKARWERTQIVSPIAGIVEDYFVDEGEFAPPAMPLVRVVNASRVKVQAEIPERYAGTIRPGMPTVVTFDALPGDTLKAKVTFLAATVSAANRTLLAEIYLPNPGRRIKPEMVAKVKMQRETRSDAILISENIVQLVDRDRHIVYTESGGKAVEHRVTLGGKQGNKIEVTDGLKVGDRLIVVGYQKLVDGHPVVVIQ